MKKILYREYISDVRELDNVEVGTRAVDPDEELLNEADKDWLNSIGVEGNSPDELHPDEETAIEKARALYKQRAQDPSNEIADPEHLRIKKEWFLKRIAHSLYTRAQNLLGRNNKPERTPPPSTQ